METLPEHARSTTPGRPVSGSRLVLTGTQLVGR
jgi:hypothetical protein